MTHTEHGAIDVATTRRLLQSAFPLPCTFHRAIDMTPCPVEALQQLLPLVQESGGRLDRVLTSGGAKGSTAQLPFSASGGAGVQKSLSLLSLYFSFPRSLLALFRCGLRC